MRKLASIRQIRKKTPIDGADKIELVKVDGWNCVAKKNEFEVGDYCVYFEIDSFLPIEDKYSFLKNDLGTMLGEKGYRIKSSRFMGVLSQGLALPLKFFDNLSDCSLGDDVTDLLGVKKYENQLPACLCGEAKSRFPGFIRKTDQERIQNIPFIFDSYSDCYFECTEKLDGSSMTVFFNDGEFGVCSRNLQLKKNLNNTFWKVCDDIGLETALSKFNSNYGRNIAIQGELIGEGIQKNKLKTKGHQFRLFDIWDIDNKKYMTMDERNIVYTIISQYLNKKLLCCPVVCVCKLKDIGSSVDGVLDFVKGWSLINKNSKREGIVFKSKTTIDDNIVSFKGINNEYLIGGK
jgi:RNA ligase (TIGR02306 family)